MDVSVIPSLPAQSFREIRELTEALAPVTNEVQVDMVDGHFAKQASWPFTESDPREALDKLKSLTGNWQIEVDCMLMHPEQYLDLFAELGVSRVIVHAGSTERYEDIFRHPASKHFDVGIALLNDTPLPAIKSVLDQVSFIQVMGIATVGSQGQPFDEHTPETVRALRSAYPEYTIAVDGSVNSETIQRLQEAGANRFAPGSAVAKALDPAAAYTELAGLVAHSS